MHLASEKYLNIYKLVLILALLSLVSKSKGAPTSCSRDNGTSSLQQLPELHGKRFYYFGYGSNMLESRIRLMNPSARRIGVALLNHYRLDFNTFSSRWQGAPATVVPSKHDYTYGALWDMDAKDLKQLDKQEGVDVGYYEAQSVAVSLILNDNNLASLELMARVYLLTNQPDTKLDKFSWEQVPEERQPSKTYLQCLVKGAEETGVPTNYVDWLRSIKHNSRVVEHLQNVLDLQDVKVS